MARIVTGPVVADIAGKVGDNIFSRNKYGPYVKAYAVPTIPGSSYVTAARTAMTNANAAWSALSDTEKLNYASFSSNYPVNSFHDGYHKLDPRSFFVANYINQVFAGLTPDPQISNPPSFDFSDLDIDIPDCDNINFKTNGGSSGSTFRTIYYAYQPVNLNILSFNTLPQYAFANGNYVANSNVNLKTDYQTRWPGTYPAEDERLFGSVRIIHAASGICVGNSWNKATGTANYTYTEYGNSGSLSSTIGSAAQKASAISIPSAGYVTEITFDMAIIAQNIRFALYDDDGGKPGNLLAQTAIVAQAGGSEENTIPFTTPYYISSSGTYWVAAAASINASLYNQISGGNGSIAFTSGLTFQNPWQQNSSNTRKIFGRLELKVLDSPCGPANYTIGNDDIRTTISGLKKNQATPVTTTFSGTINGLWVYIGTPGANVKVGLYSESGGVPDALLASSGSLPTTETDDWEFFAFSSPVAVSASTDYFIALVGDGDTSFRADEIPILSYVSDVIDFVLDDPFPSGSMTTYGNSVYAEVIT